MKSGAGIMRLFASWRNIERMPPEKQRKTALKVCDSPLGTSAAILLNSSRSMRPRLSMTARKDSTWRDTVSMSSTTCSADRSENRTPLYTGQKAHRFQGQFLVTRMRRLSASLGGRIGPCSNPQYSSVFLDFSFMSVFVRQLVGMSRMSFSSKFLLGQRLRRYV